MSKWLDDRRVGARAERGVMMALGKRADPNGRAMVPADTLFRSAQAYERLRGLHRVSRDDVDRAVRRLIKKGVLVPVDNGAFILSVEGQR